MREQSQKSHSLLLKACDLPTINWQGKSGAFVPSGTVILPSRGTRGGYFKASCLIDEPKRALPLVVTSQFLVIRPRAGVLAEFLAWSLNQPEIQFWLSEGGGSQGSSLAVMLKTSIVHEISLNIPPLETQQKIIKLNSLWEKEQKLNALLQVNRQKMLQGMYKKLLKEKA